MLYSSYDKETNEFQKNLSESDIIKLIKHIGLIEDDRASFYEFEDENGKKFDYWDLKNKFNVNNMIYIYAGYYEIYVTDKHLNKPFVQVYTAESVNAANAYLMDVDDHILIDEDLKDYFDDFNGLFTVKNGLPELLENSDNEK